MPNICIIPARGGSRRIPDKNIREFCGRPIIHYSIEAAKQSGFFQRIIVSSDSEKIGAVAARAGGVFLKRRATLAGDDVPMAAVVIDVLNYYLAKGEPYEKVCMVYATAPFLTVPMIAEGYQKMAGVDVSFAVFKESARAERQMVMLEGQLISRHPEFDNVNSNYWPETYQHAGLFFWADTAKLCEYRTLMLPRKAGVIVPSWACQDFDEPEDWEAAEIKYRVVQERRGPKAGEEE